MTPEELAAFKYFSQVRTRADGTPINWVTADKYTVRILEDLHADTGAAIQIVRETHPDKPNAIDFNVPGLTMDELFPHLDPRPVAIGYYAGTHGPTYHLDVRAIVGSNRAARWMAIRPDDESRLGSQYTPLIYDRTSEWLYLQWGHRLSFTCLIQVMAIANANRARTEGAKHAT